MSCFSGLFPSHFLSISESTFRRLELPNRGFCMECIAKIDLSQKSFFITFTIDFYCFLKALGPVFQVLSLENKLENTMIFSNITVSEFGIWWGRSMGYLGPPKTQKHSLIAEKHDR